tara:strand:+ start:587 stop:775 length:189 start_codon:yes stop_codon:yes gene_type:complete
VTDKLTNSVTSSFDDALYDFAKADAQFRGFELAGYMRNLVEERRDEKIRELKVFHHLMDSEK